MRKLRIEEMKRLTEEEFKISDKRPIIIILDNIRSMNNVGSIFRTADALRIQHIYLCGITAPPPHTDIHKTALGAEEVVSWSYVEDTAMCVKRLKEEGYQLFAIEQAEGSTMLDHYQDKYREMDHAVAIVMGNEVNGVRQDVIDLCDDCIEIPQYGTKHSMNVSVAAGIVLWELSKSFQ